MIQDPRGHTPSYFRIFIVWYQITKKFTQVVIKNQHCVWNSMKDFKEISSVSAASFTKKECHLNPTDFFKKIVHRFGI